MSNLKSLEISDPGNGESVKFVKLELLLLENKKVKKVKIGDGGRKENKRRGIETRMRITCRYMRIDW